MQRTRKERVLKRDIGEKNRIRRRLISRMREAARYEGKGAETVSDRWKRRYAATAARLRDEIEARRADVLRRNGDLERRIQEERKISLEEVKAFQAQYEKELREYEEARKKHETAADDLTLTVHAMASASQQISREEKERLRHAEATLGRAESREKREKQDVERVEKELASEARDERLFVEELKRIAAERIALKT